MTPWCRRGIRDWARLALLTGAIAGTGSTPARAQIEAPGLGLADVEATPIGALPPMALPMPASRNHNYWVFRVQAGHRRGRAGPDLLAIAGGIDLQWRGGSIFGVTGGYQTGDCESCEGHLLFGARGRFNVLTGGPTIGALIGDYSATSTLGAELGFGWAPDAKAGLDVCTVDVGVPLSLAMLQRVRLVSYISPGAVLEVDCSTDPGPKRTDFMLSAGIGVQQLGLPGLDVYLGAQKAFRSGTGYQFGISVMYVRLP
ncbi:MAG: hypothetical protein ACRELV_09590 [Longimicrobiales bacterium]